MSRHRKSKEVSLWSILVTGILGALVVVGVPVLAVLIGLRFIP